MEKDAQIYLLSKVFDLIKELFKYLCYGWVAWVALLAIRSMAGKKTEADFLFSAFFSSGNDYSLPWIIAIFSSLYALAQRKLRLRVTFSLQQKIKELELRIDPLRTSSGLLPTGETNPEDKEI
jgi:hypothetical protein